MSGGGSQTSTVTSQDTLDPFIREALQQSVAAARSASQLPYVPYTGPRVAGFRPQETAAFGMAEQAATSGVGAPELALAAQTATRAAGYGPAQFQQDVSGFMSPYQQNVIDATMARLSRARAERDAATMAQLAGSRAFGNTRRGVYEAQLAAEQDLNTAQTLANLYQQGYGQAAGLAQALPAQQLAGAAALSGYGNQALQQAQTRAGMLQAAGQAQRQMAQQNLDVAYQDFLAQRGYPIEQLRIFQSGLAGLPAVTSKTQTSTVPGAGFLGTAGSAVGILGGLKELGLFG